MTPEQCRAARKRMKWTIEELATRSSLAENTIGRFENRRLKSSELTVNLLRRAFIEAGVTPETLAPPQA